MVSRIADLAELSPARPVPEMGNRGAGLEEALGAAIAARVREFRLQLGWTVGQLAAQSGLSKGMLSKIENAQASPSLATLARLSEALQVPVTAFFRGLNEEQDVMFVKAGRGLDIEHKGSGAGHRYESLGIMRAPSNTLEPLRVTLTERSNTFPLYQHAGTELIYMLSGTHGVRLRQLPLPAGVGRRAAVHRRCPARARGPGRAADPVSLDQVDNVLHLTSGCFLQ